MAIQRIERTKAQAVAQQAQALQIQQRLSLHTATTFERVGSLNFGGGARIDIPSMGQSDRDLATRLFGSVSSDGQNRLDGMSEKLGQALYQETASNAQGIKTGSFSSGFTQTVSEASTLYVNTTGNGQQDTAIQGVMFMGMLGIEKRLADFAGVAKGKIELAGETRTDMAELRDMIAKWPEGTDKQTVSWTEVKTDKDGNLVVTEHTEELTKKEAETLLKDLDGQLSNIRDMNEMDRFDLQKMTEDYQQAMNTLTAMLKEMHDTMKAIIQNVKA